MCAYCHAKVGQKQRLCTTCRAALEAPVPSQALVDAYVEAGLAEMLLYLIPRREFSEWLETH